MKRAPTDGVDQRPRRCDAQDYSPRSAARVWDSEVDGNAAKSIELMIKRMELR
jgi:hypothetical protein